MPIKKPLADLIRPKDSSQSVGQKDLIEEGRPLYQIIKKHVPISLLLWGPPGTGKTSLTQIIAREFDYPLAIFNVSTDNKAKLTQIINIYPYQPFVLLTDEIHRMTITLQDFLPPYLEDRCILLIGATTENPIMSIVPAVRSRCQTFEFKALSDEDIKQVLIRALKEVFHFKDENIDREAVKIIAVSADEDLQVALSLLETIYAVNEDLSVEEVK